VKHLGKKVHVLENNEGLLERDFATYAPLELGLGSGLGLPSPYPQPSLTRYAPFYASFGLSCAKSIDGSSDICYCLKRENNAYFNAAILRGQLELGDTVLIVDEVDDLVLNEKPSLLYRARDELLTPVYKVRVRVEVRVGLALGLELGLGLGIGLGSPQHQPFS